ncbi:DegQ family serine endoprotease [Sulfuriflexus mobilis]|uniref:DegQ family serine endoprotease n=1 Tax=Sulfuriflexus mobilis TaxID=1811807 RepID=UPI000F81D045|nr:DegQ family serine endoprotease [Sulfuriflexus mobilis]
MKVFPGKAFVFNIVLGMLGLFAWSQVQARNLPDFTQLAEKNSPAVVNISTTQKIKRHPRIPENLQIPDLPEDSPFNDFFRHFFDDEGNSPQERDAKSLGSGFIISDDGYVMTNNHVIRDADEVIVRLSDRREFSAKVVGSDERSDVALLKIDASSLPTVKMGKSKDLKVGEWVLAIGSPFGFDHSVTAGIVSAKGRSLPRENYVPFIQTDVAINPGNSGGPLFNLDGEVVGVNSQIYSRTGGFMGLSFAIPIEVAMNVANQLKNTGHVTRGWLGVLIQDVTAELAESFGMDKPHGALVSRVLPDSPAAKAGFEVGDIILKFNSDEVDHSKDLPPLVGRTPIDTAVPVRVLRQGKLRTLKVVIGELPGDDEIRVASDKPKTSKQNRIGLTVTDLSDAQRKKREIAKGGVLVSQSGGIAARAGIRQGDIIEMLNNEDIKNVEHFEKLVKALPENRSVPVLVHRARSGPVFLALKITNDE